MGVLCWGGLDLVWKGEDGAERRSERGGKRLRLGLGEVICWWLMRVCETGLKIEDVPKRNKKGKREAA